MSLLGDREWASLGVPGVVIHRHSMVFCSCTGFLGVPY